MAYDFNSLTKQAAEASNRDKFYTDFEDVDPNVLHQISELTDWMRTKAKGSDVREVIAQLFERTWLEESKEGNANMEVAKARGRFPVLNERLNNADRERAENTQKLAQKANKDEVTNVMTPKGTLAYASLPRTGNQVGWFYYCPDGDGVHGAGNYVWNGSSWFFGGTGNEGYNLLKKDISYLEEVYFKKVINSGNHWLDIKPTVGQKYKITNNSTGSISVGLYDSSKTLIKNLGSVNSNNTYTFDIDNNAYYLLVYVPADGSVTIEEITKKVPKLEKGLDKVSSNLDNVSRNLDKVSRNLNKYVEPFNLIDIGDFYYNSSFEKASTPDVNGKIIAGNDTVCIVPVKPNGVYYFTQLSSVYYNIVLYDDNMDFISTLYSFHGNKGDWNREWSVPDNCYYVGFYISDSFKDTAFFGTNYYEWSLSRYKYHLNNLIKIDNIETKKNHRLFVEKSIMNDDDILELDVSNIKQNNTFTFSGKLNSAFNSLYLAHGKESAYNGMFVKVDNTKLYFYRYHTSPILVKSVEHGLTISDFINVSVNILQNQTAKVIITTTGGKFESENRWQGSKGTISAELENCSMSNCILTYYCSDYDKKLWAFGDSWFYDYTYPRWPELVINDGYAGAMFDGYGGNTSLNAYSSLQKCLQFGKPDTILWCLGMNDPDSSSKVNSEWNSVFNKLKKLCTELNINLILCTIATSSTNNHNFKNEIIRKSGYRYVDISFALGAEESTDWYSGLQASDHIHPTAQGSNVIASRMIAEVPELLG